MVFSSNLSVKQVLQYCQLPFNILCSTQLGDVNYFVSAAYDVSDSVQEKNGHCVCQGRPSYGGNLARCFIEILRGGIKIREKPIGTRSWISGKLLCHIL